MTIAVSLHILAAVIWIGGMFFTFQIVRPSVADLEPKDRLHVWGESTTRFYRWAWAAVATLLVTGYWMIYQGWGGFADLPLHIHVMHGTGWLMAAIFAYVYFVPFARFKAARANGNPPEMVRHLHQMRAFVTANFVLGVVNLIVGSSGRYW